MAAAYRGMDIAAVANSPALKSVGHRQCATLVRLQSNFLCQHNVACDEITFGHEVPANSRTAGAIDLMDVHRGAVAARFFELGGLKPPPAKELPHTFVFHFTVCAFAHALQWNAMGGAEKPEKLVNDLSM